MQSRASAGIHFNLVLLVASLLLAVGLLMMTSASVEIASSQFNDPFYHFKRQGIFALMGLSAMINPLHVPDAIRKKSSWILLIGSYEML